MDREAKAKGVVSVWGTDFVHFLAMLAVLPRSIWKNSINSTVSSKSTEAKQLVRQGIEQNLPPQPDVTIFSFASVFVLLLWALHKECYHKICVIKIN